MMKSRKILAIVLSAAMVMTAMAFPVASSAATKKKTVKRTLLKETSWNTDVKKNVNTLVSTYGKGTKNYKKKTYKTAYAVFDFDNTSSIFDVEEQLAIYQLDHMAFAFAPEKLPSILATGIESNLNDKAGTEYSENDATYQDWIDDITDSYTALYNKYGPFDAKGITDAAKLDEMHKDENFIDFKTKMRAMYDLIGDNFSAATSYPWILYWFTGMTPQEKYDLAYKSHKQYAKTTTSIDTLTSVKKDTKTGIVSVKHNTGVQVSKNIKELYKTLSKNGIRVWVCSASDIDVVRAAVDAFGLHNYVTGVLAMTNKTENGKYINAYDYETGVAAYPKANGKWTKGSVATKAQTQGAGKVTAINNVLVKKYGHGPIAGFMDSTGDFQFCTEYKTLKLVVCFNRATRKITDGGGLIAGVAYYQKYHLKYDLKKANKKGDTLYLLQGRDETGTRSFRNSMMTKRWIDPKTTKVLMFRGSDNWMQVAYMIEHKMSTKSAINTFAVKTAADAANNDLGLKYGFTDPISKASALKNNKEDASTTFTGYHSLK
jgi:phosphoglycolate phosphatase-like HAD superfamily hydrolase